MENFKTLKELKSEAINGTLDRREYNAVYAALYDMEELLKQIRQTNIYKSWGVESVEYGLYKEFPSIVLNVSGLKHTGKTVWGLDEGQDLYFCVNIDENGSEAERKDEVYLDMVLQSLDGLIERDPEWTDEEYRERATADSRAKGVNII